MAQQFYYGSKQIYIESTTSVRIKFIENLHCNSKHQSNERAFRQSNTSPTFLLSKPSLIDQCQSTRPNCRRTMSSSLKRRCNNIIDPYNNTFSKGSDNGKPTDTSNQSSGSLHEQLNTPSQIHAAPTFYHQSTQR